MLEWVFRGRQVLRREREAKRANGVYVFEAWGAWIQVSIASTLLLTVVLAFVTFGFDIDVPILIAMTLAAIACAVVSSVVLGLSELLGVSGMTLWQDILIVGVVAGALLMLGIPQGVLAEPLWSYYP